MTKVTNLPVRHQQQIATIKLLEDLLRRMKGSIGPDFAQGVIILLPDPHTKGKVSVLAPKGMNTTPLLKAALEGQVGLIKRTKKAKS